MSDLFRWMESIQLPAKRTVKRVHVVSRDINMDEITVIYKFELRQRIVRNRYFV